MDQIVLVRHQIEGRTFSLVFRIHIQRFDHPMYCDILILKLNFNNDDDRTDDDLTTIRTHRYKDHLRTYRHNS